MYFHNIELSKTMKDYLKGKALKNDVKPSKTTINALIKRGLCDETGELTETGEIVSRGVLSLVQQCKLLDYPLEKLELNYEGRPENAVIDYLKDKGLTSYHSENTFGFHIAEFFLFKYNYQKAKRENEKIPNIEFSKYFFDDDFFEHLDKRIRSINEDLIIETHQLIKRLNGNFNPYDRARQGLWLVVNSQLETRMLGDDEDREIPNFYQQIWDLDFYLNTYRYFGIDFIEKYIKFIVYNGRNYVSGWPDLVVFNDTIPYFIEVKTSDKLSNEQIETFNAIRSELEVPIKVVKVSRQKMI